MMSKQTFKTETAYDYIKVLKYQKYIIGNNGYIAGGCFKNIFNGEEVKDIDVFFRSMDDFHKAVNQYKENEDYKKIFENEMAIGYWDNKEKVQVELVRSRVGEPKEVLEEFDFTITKFALHSDKAFLEDSEEDDDYGWETNVTFHEDFFEHLILKRLVIDSELDHPLSTFDRMLRYSGYGYGACIKTKEKIVRMINAMELPKDSEGLFKSLYNGID